MAANSKAASPLSATAAFSDETSRSLNFPELSPITGHPGSPSDGRSSTSAMTAAGRTSLPGAPVTGRKPRPAAAPARDSDRRPNKQTTSGRAAAAPVSPVAVSGAGIPPGAESPRPPAGRPGPRNGDPSARRAASKADPVFLAAICPAFSVLAF
ncbi:hypothetical protein [Moorella sp. E306M]|uniref:hypothetical protein n=1 Tax=Moorella sp. E306M TaxID=2572683 RepID=UPI00209C4C1E|nr:hypothetical protein [Moorella sp. E306M]